MKIVFLSSMHKLNDKRVHDKEACSLRKAGFDVVHICPTDIFNEVNQTRIIDGVIVKQYPLGKNFYSRILNLKRLYYLARNENADAYHCNEVDSWFIGVFLKLLIGKLCIFDVHEHYPSAFAQSRFPNFFQPVVALIVKFVFLILVPFTDRLILAKQTVSSDFFCRANKKILVRNFTPLNRIRISNARKVRKINSTLKIVHLGLFNKMRGWPQVLEALTMCSSVVKLIVIGTINDGTNKEFTKKIKDYKLCNNVTILDWMPFEKAFEHLLNADIGLIAFQPNIQNHVYAMPHKLFDYMAAGMSVILPKQAVEVAPIVDRARCGLLIDPSKSEEIYKAINFIENNPKEAYEMGFRGSEVVMKTYNWESEVKKLVIMYKELFAYCETSYSIA